jgi:hypothetical protein
MLDRYPFTILLRIIHLAQQYSCIESYLGSGDWTSLFRIYICLTFKIRLVPQTTSTMHIRRAGR